MANIESHLRLRKSRLILLAAAVCVLGGAGLLYYENQNPIHFRDKTPSIELGESFNPKDNIRHVFMGTPDDVQVSGYVNGLIPDTYEVDYLYRGKTYTIRVEVADRKAPDLKVRNVDAGLNEEVDAESFVESCTDASRFTISIANPDALRYATGSREVQVQATDEYGNTVIKTARLRRFNDTIPPISADTPATRTFMVSEEFVPQEFSFTEGSAEDYRIEVENSGLDMNTPGNYTVRYRFWDPQGHMTTFTETIVVEALPQEDGGEAEMSDEGFIPADEAELLPPEEEGSEEPEPEEE